MKKQLLLAVSIFLCLQPAQAQVQADFRKATLELPTARILKSTDSPKAISASPSAAERSCSPGLVRWHSTYKEALQAAQQSGKPVLLFQLMGRLDQEFC